VKLTDEQIELAAEGMADDLRKVEAHGCKLLNDKRVGSFVIDGHVDLRSLARAALTAAIQGSVVVPAPNDLAKLTARCENFKNGTKKLFEGGPTKGDMWFFELYHHLTDCAAALGNLPLPRHDGKDGAA
jgi:hypothetical protein